jgi:hypothetical protein
MRSNGSAYVSAVLAVLAAYFAYQWWFNPHRVIKRQLGEVAAVLSAPAGEQDVARLARLARLRQYLAESVRVHLGRSGPDIASRDAVLAALASQPPAPGGLDVRFVDVEVTVDSAGAGRAYLTADLASRDSETGRSTLDTRDAALTLADLDGAWLITEVDVKDLPQRP